MITAKNDNIQFLRAMAIIAVVCIHTCPIGMSQVIFRPFINFAVALFVFLSGYLTKIENDNWLFFYKKRITRVLIPYIIWSTIYTFYDYLFVTNDLSILPHHLLFASVRAHLYYIPVYIGLVIITPLMGTLVKSRYRHIAWMVTPFYMILFFYTRFVPQVHIKPLVLTILGLCFFSWFSYYYFGILCGNSICKKTYSRKLLYTLLFFSILLQITEAYILYKSFNYTNCGTQGKLSTLLTNMIILLVVYSFLSSSRLNIQCSFLHKIGDYSFGIYLCHILVINVFSTFSIFSFYRSLPYPINSLLILFISFAFCYCCDHILSSRLGKYLGIR